MNSLAALVVAVAGLGEQPAVDFDNDVMPVLTKAGCNTGACHGAAVGRGGFKLSLYGGDPAADYKSMVLQLEGRRVNLADPEESLLLLKPTQQLEHEGGYRLPYDGAGAALLLEWVRQGAKRKEGKRLTSLKVSPRSIVVSTGKEATPDSWREPFTIQAIATFSDGSSKDVTDWTVFTPEDRAAVEIDEEKHTARLLRRGRHIVVARYLDRVIALEAMAPLTEEKLKDAGKPSHFIDRHIEGLLGTLRLPQSPQATDEALLRRLSIDLTGRLPTENEWKAFVTDKSADKRARLVDALLKSEEFNDYWTLELAKLLRIRSQPQDTQGARTYHDWLRVQVARGVGYDKMVTALLTSQGDTHQVGPANFYRTVAGPREQAEFASELFMGNRLRCANCHNHPLDRWTQDDYHGLAAVFARLSQGRVIKVTTKGEVKNPRTGEDAIPRIPGKAFLEPQADGRQAFARWLVDSNNPYFAKAMVNRLWKAMMGRGLVEPTDDLRDTNPATHPKLLEELAADFVQSGYSLRHTLRTIALSDAYARSSQSLTANAADDRFYSHAVTRPLRPEVLADAISDVTGVAERFGKEPMGTRAVTLFDPKIPSQTLDVLGRCAREDTCETNDAGVGGLSRKLHLMNGPLLNKRISNPKGRLAKLLAAGETGPDIVRTFYRAALGREPDERETAFWNKQLADTPKAQRNELLEDFVWSLLSCREFVTNH